MKRLSLLKNERGIASVWIAIMIAIFGFGIVYTITYDIVCVQLMNTVIGNAGADTPQAFFDNINKFRLLYGVMPFIFLFGIILYGFVRSQKEAYR